MSYGGAWERVQQCWLFRVYASISWTFGHFGSETYPWNFDIMDVEQERTPEVCTPWLEDVSLH